MPTRMPTPGARAAFAFFCGLAACMPAVGVNAAPDALAPGCDLAGAREAGAPPAAPASPPVFPPVQLQVRTPLAPTVLPSGGRNYLVYELHLHNFAPAPLTLRGIEVFDAARGAATPLLALDGARLDARLRQVTIGDDPGAVRVLGTGQGAVAFLCLAFEAGQAVPARLRHRILLDDAFADGPAIGTRATALRELGPPLAGAGWVPSNNPSLHSHHRMGLWVVDGSAQIARRYAIDWKKFDARGKPYAGNAREVRAYYAYGQQVLAVADGRVVLARDGFPDNVPKTDAGFAPALPVTLETVGGNQVVIDLGDGQFAAYYHLQPGSVRVRPGQQVRRGQLLARVGNSGDARWPHLHFQVSDRPETMAGEGLPHLFTGYRVKAGDGSWQARRREYPMGELVIDFGPNL